MTSNGASPILSSPVTLAAPTLDQKNVVKFGGSNLRRPDDIDRVVNLVHTCQRPLVLVVATFFGITNALIACVQA